jgi:DNA-binding protein H-NS
MDDARLERMSIKELRDLLARVDKAIGTVEQRERAEFVAGLEAMAAARGLTLAEVMGEPEPTRGRRGKRGA